MNIVAAPTLGGKVKDPFNLKESKKIPNESGLNSDNFYENKLQSKSDRSSRAINPIQSTDLYKIRGAFVDKLA